MGKIFVGLNTEFSRSSDKPFEWAVEETAKMGYEYIEPMVHFGRELMSEAGYFHTVSMFNDPYIRLLLLRGMAWSSRQWPYELDALAKRGIVLKD